MTSQRRATEHDRDAADPKQPMHRIEAALWIVIPIVVLVVLAALFWPR